MKIKTAIFLLSFSSCLSAQAVKFTLPVVLDTSLVNYDYSSIIDSSFKIIEENGKVRHATELEKKWTDTLDVIDLVKWPDTAKKFKLDGLYFIPNDSTTQPERVNAIRYLKGKGTRKQILRYVRRLNKRYDKFINGAKQPRQLNDPIADLRKQNKNLKHRSIQERKRKQRRKIKARTK